MSGFTRSIGLQIGILSTIFLICVLVAYSVGWMTDNAVRLILLVFGSALLSGLLTTWVSPFLPRILSLLAISLAPFRTKLPYHADRQHGLPPETQWKPVARIKFKLEDPVDPGTFSQFLDQPMMITRQESSSRRRKTPCQILEESVFRYAKQLEKAHRRRLMVNVTIKRGSFVIGLSFLAAYDFLAQYHDFVESITLMRKQVGGLVQDASDWYRILTGRDFRVESSIEFVPSAAKAEKRKNDPKPIVVNKQIEKEPTKKEQSSVISNLMSPSTGLRDLYINIYPQDRSLGLVPPFLFLGFLLIFIFFGFGIFCWLNQHEFCEFLITQVLWIFSR